MTALVEGYRDTGSIVRLWFRALPGARARLLALAAVPLIWFALRVATDAGPSVLNYARRGAGDAVGQYTANYVVALQDGDLGALGMSIVAAVALAGFISPFTSGGNVALIPATDLLGVRPARLHSYFMSLMTTAVSIIGFFQIISLTMFASLLAIDGNPFAPTIIAWLTWVPLLALTAAQSWFTELMIRSVSRRVRLVATTFLVGGVTAALFLAPTARALVGDVTAKYSNLLRAVSLGDRDMFMGAVAVLVAVTFLCVGLGFWLCQRTLMRPVHVPTKRSDILVPLRPSNNPYVMLFQVTLAQVLRTRETRRPMMVILAVNLLGAWFVASPQQNVSALLTLPIAIGASWAANMFGLLGPGLTWMASQPNLMKVLPYVTFPVQAVISFLAVNVCWVTVMVAHGMSVQRFISLELASVAVIAVMTRAAFTHSVKHPSLTRLGGRGDTAVRPTQAISYTLRTIPVAGAVASGILAIDNLIVAAGLVVGVLSWESVRWIITDKKWADMTVRAGIVRTVGSA